MVYIVHYFVYHILRDQYKIIPEINFTVFHSIPKFLCIHYSFTSTGIVEECTGKEIYRNLLPCRIPAQHRPGRKPPGRYMKVKRQSTVERVWHTDPIYGLTESKYHWYQTGQQVYTAIRYSL